MTVQSLRERIKQDEESKTGSTMEAPPNENESAQNHEEEGNTSKYCGIKDKSSSDQTSDDPLVRIVGSHITGLTRPFHATSSSVHSTNSRDVSMD